jgi:hypothetical protein
MHHLAYALSLLGVAHATCEMECADDDDARLRAVRFLEAHPIIEIWKGARRVARLTKSEASAGDFRDGLS